MRKYALMSIALLAMVIALAVVGCGGQKAAEETPPPAEQTTPPVETPMDTTAAPADTMAH
jgi:PBP1b-binding outer membrane lipoprotein LpoB